MFYFPVAARANDHKFRGWNYIDLLLIYSFWGLKSNLGLTDLNVGQAALLSGGSRGKCVSCVFPFLEAAFIPQLMVPFRQLQSQELQVHFFFFPLFHVGSLWSSIFTSSSLIEATIGSPLLSLCVIRWGPLG